MPDSSTGPATARRVAAVAPPVRAGMAGLRLQRMIGTDAVGHLDPFLVLTEFGHPEPGTPLGGFPDHPHRGFETVTYMIEGSMRHRDSTGADGIIGPGGAQWMTAGRGVIHSEFPEPGPDGRLLGFQLWVNLPSRLKMTAPAYRDLAADQIPETDLEGGARLRVIAGEVAGTAGPVRDGAVAPLVLDLRLAAGGRAALPLPAGHNAFVYAVEGDLAVGDGDGAVIPAKHLAVLGPGGRLDLADAGGAGARLLIAAARPLSEPVVAYGPFVMNTEQEIYQAFKDYQEGRF
jgi:redox-sensitive bicupin YhaK (pirin superfamily)